MAKAICDVCVNIFAKPYQTALALLSLIKHCREHIGTLWLQFEPAGSRFDDISPYTIAFYLKETKLVPLKIFQPATWFDCAVADPARFSDESYRMGLRFEYALEHAASRWLFLMHNDIVVHKNLLGALLEAKGTYFALGQLGQCWNCPASLAPLTEKVLRRPPCRPEHYTAFRPSAPELCALYEAADKGNYFRRSYSDGLTQDFLAQPWPLPECRVNEWACLLDLQTTRPLTQPFGAAPPIGAYVPCGRNTLDIGVAWFRAMHAKGLTAGHFSPKTWFTHFVGTGKKSALRYTQAEVRAKQLLAQSFPDFMAWLARATPKARV